MHGVSHINCMEVVVVGQAVVTRVDNLGSMERERKLIRNSDLCHDFETPESNNKIPMTWKHQSLNSGKKAVPVRGQSEICGTSPDEQASGR